MKKEILEKLKALEETFKKKNDRSSSIVLGSLIFCGFMLLAWFYCSAFQLYLIPTIFLIMFIAGFIFLIIYVIVLYYKNNKSNIVPEYKSIVKILNEERTKAIQSHKFNFDIDDKDLETELLKKYLKSFIDRGTTYKTKPIEDQLNFDEEIKEFQKFLDKKANEINVENDQHKVREQLEEYIKTILPNYYFNEQQIIKENARKSKYTSFEIAKNKVILYNDDKTIVTIAEINKLKKRRELILNTTNNDYDRENFNNSLEKYYYSNIADLKIPLQSSYNSSFYSDRKYKNRCWHCGTPINESVRYSKRKCSFCGYYHCSKCGACFCGKESIDPNYRE